MRLFHDDQWTEVDDAKAATIAKVASGLGRYRQSALTSASMVVPLRSITKRPGTGNRHVLPGIDDAEIVLKDATVERASRREVVNKPEFPRDGGIVIHQDGRLMECLTAYGLAAAADSGVMATTSAPRSRKA